MLNVTVLEINELMLIAEANRKNQSTEIPAKAGVALG